MSHLECYKKLLASDQEFALIVEDDIGFKWNEPYDDILKISARYIRSKKPLVLLNFAFFDYMGKVFQLKIIIKYIRHIRRHLQQFILLTDKLQI